jgi:hypothetical protein
MGAAADTLTAMIDAPDRFTHSAKALKTAQIAALDERLREQRDAIKLVRLRADDEGVDAIRSLEEAVPLLLPHTAYKSYPETFLTEKRWDRLTRWLGTVSAYPTDKVDLSQVTEIDDWVEACAAAGLFVSCSSGTTGKSAMLVASQHDLDFASRDGILAVEWGSDIRVGDMRAPAGAVGSVAYTPRNAAMGQALNAAFNDPASARFDPGIKPLTVGSLTQMITLRKKVTDGTALPEEIAAYEAESNARAKALEEAQVGAVDDVIAKRGKKLYLMGLWGSLYPFAVAVRERGYSAKDFHPENGLYIGGGLKRAKLPADYREFVYETFNLHPRFTYQMYGMQELGTSMPRCQEGGRYHVPPWLVVLPLDKDGSALQPGWGSGQVEGRAAFFDLSMDGRWGGVISGDHIHVDFEPCACGNASPSIRDDIYRYADLEGDDKIGCAGTVDAYVRGMA